MTFLTCFPAYANENAMESFVSIPINNNEVWIFPTEDDYNAYLKEMSIKTDEDMISPQYVTEHEISRTTWYHKWICYHKSTPTWTKASSYTVNAGTKCSGSIAATYAGVTFTLSLTKTQNVTTTIPADSSRYSRLSLSGDFLVKKMTRFYHDNSGVYDQYDYISYTKLNSYIDVTYQ